MLISLNLCHLCAILLNLPVAMLVDNVKKDAINGRIMWKWLYLCRIKLTTRETGQGLHWLYGVTGWCGRCQYLLKSDKYPDVKYSIKLGYRNIGFNGKFYTFPYFLAFLLKRFLADRKKDWLPSVYAYSSKTGEMHIVSSDYSSIAERKKKKLRKTKEKFVFSFISSK